LNQPLGISRPGHQRSCNWTSGHRPFALPNRPVAAIRSWWSGCALSGPPKTI